MKSTFALAILAILCIGIASCSNETTTNNMDELPASVQNVVNTQFTGKVVTVTTESEAIGVNEYEIYLDNGTKLTFVDEEWDEIEMPLGQNVPAYFVLSPISEYVTTNHPGQAIVKIDREKEGYEIELGNGLDIKFDTNGNFIKVDR